MGFASLDAQIRLVREQIAKIPPASPDP